MPVVGQSSFSGRYSRLFGDAELYKEFVFDRFFGQRRQLGDSFRVCVSIFLYRALTQVWCNSKSQKAAKAFGFNKITTDVLLLNDIDSQNAQNVD
jgi:hypothetical protein